MLLGALGGVHFGVTLSHRISGRNIRKYFAGVIAVGIALVLFSLGQSLWPSAQ
jgi:uncharacterized membrane protein YfcA